jgi:HK97 family phage major capsid protein
MNATELFKRLEALRNEYKTKWDSYATKTMPNGDNVKDIPANDLEGLNKLMADINEVGKSYEQARKIEDFNKANDEAIAEGRKGVNNVPVAGKAEVKAFNSLSDELLSFKDWRSGVRSGEGIELDAKGSLIERIQMKTLMTTSANGYPPEVLRDGTVVPIIQRPPQLLDYLAIEPTNQNGIKFMAQTVRTNAAVAKSEGAAVDESVITYAEQTDIISKIGASIPVTDEELEDEPGLRSLVDNDLVGQCREILDTYVTVGTAAPPIFAGVYNATSVQTQAKGADPVFDTLMKAYTKVRVTGRANPNLYVLHSNDWQDLCLTRTADGIYILGNPSNGVPLRMWGLPVALSEALTEGTGLCLDTFYFRVKMRKGVTIAVTDSHASEFISSITRIRATMRAGLKKMRGQAACTITGI